MGECYLVFTLDGFHFGTQDQVSAFGRTKSGMNRYLLLISSGQLRVCKLMAQLLR